MLTIGFANQYYTLWEVGTPYKKYGAGMVINGVFTGSFEIVQDCHYIQNLSKDFEQAKAKISGDYVIDLDLRGHSTWTRSTGNTGNDFPSDRFPYGKLMGELISESNDIWQLNRAMNQGSPRTRVHARRRLIELGELVKYNGRWMSVGAAESAKRLAWVDSLERGHFFNDGAKVELSVKEIGRFGFDSAYGYTTIVTYVDSDNRMFKYMGSNPPEDLTAGFAPIKATVKHSSYNGQLETKLLRIKILCPVS
jgi:hypothetical protein